MEGIGSGEIPQVTLEKKTHTEVDLISSLNDAKENNTTEQIRRINSIPVYPNEDVALGLKENSWSTIERAFQGNEEYPDANTQRFGEIIKNNFPGQFEVRCIQWPKIDEEEPHQTALARRRKLLVDNTETVITEIIELPEDKKDERARFIARIAKNNGKIINMFDLVGEDYKDNVYLRFRSKLPPMPSIMKTMLTGSDSMGSRIDNNSFVLDETGIDRNRGALKKENYDELDANEMTFLHESGHTNQKIFDEFYYKISQDFSILSLKKQMFIEKEAHRYMERNAWTYAMMAIRKLAQKGIPIISQNTNFEKKIDIVEDGLKGHNLDNLTLRRKTNSIEDTKSFMRSIIGLFQIE